MTTVYILRTDVRSTSHFGKCRTAISLEGTDHPIRFVFGFLGRRIECLYFLFDQIQDRGRQPSCIILNDHISETVHPIQFVFGSRVKV